MEADDAFRYALWILYDIYNSGNRMYDIHYWRSHSPETDREKQNAFPICSVNNSGIYCGISIGGDNLKILNYLKNRTVLGISCIVLAFIICFVVSPLISNTSEKTITVVRVLSDIKSGDEITKDMVSEVKMSGTNQPDNIISDDRDVIGKYAVMDMTKGDNVLKSKISDTAYVENTYLSGLNGTNRAISVTLKSFATGLSGKLKSGDIVSIIAPDYHKTGMTVVPPELQFVEVIAATNKSGADVENATGEESDLPSTVTLLVSEKQALILAELEKSGTIHMSLVYRGDRKKAEEFLKAQEDLNNPQDTDESEADKNGETE